MVESWRETDARRGAMRPGAVMSRYRGGRVDAESGGVGESATGEIGRNREIWNA